MTLSWLICQNQTKIWFDSLTQQAQGNYIPLNWVSHLKIKLKKSNTQNKTEKQATEIRSKKTSHNFFFLFLTPMTVLCFHAVPHWWSLVLFWELSVCATWTDEPHPLKWIICNPSSPDSRKDCLLLILFSSKSPPSF